MNIQAVGQQHALITEVRCADFWQNPSIEKLEKARKALRGIMKYRKQGGTGTCGTPTTGTADDGIEV